MKKTIKIFASVSIGWLIVNCFFWAFCWLVGEPFDKLGWISMALDMFKYTLRDVPMDFVVQTIAGIMYIITPIGMMLLTYKLLFNNK